jgi:hypothetical protein
LSNVWTIPTGGPNVHAWVRGGDTLFVIRDVGPEDRVLVWHFDTPEDADAMEALLRRATGNGDAEPAATVPTVEPVQPKGGFGRKKT